MVQIMIGVKGTGKTKALIEQVNAAASASAGSVVCIEKGDTLRFDVTYQVRLTNSTEYGITDAQALYGFIAGIFASNHDITHIFIDSALKVSGGDKAAFDAFLSKVAPFCEVNGINLVMTVSLGAEEATAEMKKYIA